MGIEEHPASIGKMGIDACGKVTTPVSVTLERVEHDIAFIARAVISITDDISGEQWESVMSTKRQLQKLVDFYEALPV